MTNTISITAEAVTRTAGTLYSLNVGDAQPIRFRTARRYAVVAYRPYAHRADNGGVYVPFAEIDGTTDSLATANRKANTRRANVGHGCKVATVDLAAGVTL